MDVLHVVVVWCQDDCLRRGVFFLSSFLNSLVVWKELLTVGDWICLEGLTGWGLQNWTRNAVRSSVVSSLCMLLRFLLPGLSHWLNASLLVALLLLGILDTYRLLFQRIYFTVLHRKVLRLSKGILILLLEGNIVSLVHFWSWIRKSWLDVVLLFVSALIREFRATLHFSWVHFWTVRLIYLLLSLWIWVLSLVHCLVIIFLVLQVHHLLKLELH